MEGISLIFDIMQTVRETLNEGRTPEQAPERGSAAFLAAIVALALTIASVVFFKVANASIDRSIERETQETADIETSIAALEADHDVRAYGYYQGAREEVERSIRLSMAQKYLTEFMRVSQKYGVDFTGFSFSDGQITTSAVSQDRGEVRFDAAEKVSDMIAEYRTNRDDSLFLLDPIMSLQGNSDLRNFGIIFRIDETEALKVPETASGATAPRRIQEPSAATGSSVDALR